VSGVVGTGNVADFNTHLQPFLLFNIQQYKDLMHQGKKMKGRKRKGKYFETPELTMQETCRRADRMSTPLEPPADHTQNATSITFSFPSTLP